MRKAPPDGGAFFVKREEGRGRTGSSAPTDKIVPFATSGAFPQPCCRAWRDTQVPPYGGIGAGWFLPGGDGAGAFGRSRAPPLRGDWRCLVAFIRWGGYWRVWWDTQVPPYE